MATPDVDAVLLLELSRGNDISGRGRRRGEQRRAETEVEAREHTRKMMRKNGTFMKVRMKVGDKREPVAPMISYSLFNPMGRRKPPDS